MQTADSLMKIFGCEEDKDLADIFGRDKSVVSHWRKKGLPPAIEKRAYEKMAELGINVLATHTVTEDNYVLLPKYNPRPAMGPPEDAPYVEYIESFHTFSRDLIINTLRACVDNLALVYVDGDSMEPTLSKGDIVIIDISKNFVTGSGIYAINIDHKPLVKRVHRLANGDVKIISDNPTYRSYDETFTSESVKELRIAGRVVWKSGRVL